MADQPQISDTDASANPPQPGLKFLEFAVYFMGGLLIIMLLILLIGIAWKASRRETLPAEPAKLIELGLPRGTPASSFALDGDRLAINAGNEIIVVDIKKGAVLSRIKLTTP
jgi:hypothetical protein